MSTEQYAELAELAGGFIHEIKNHLSTLKLNLQLLAEEFADPQTHRERRALDRTAAWKHECERLVDLSNDFLRFARLSDLELKPAELGPVIDELLDFFGPMARAANIDIKTYLSGDLPSVALERDLFKQAVLNLIAQCDASHARRRRADHPGRGGCRRRLPEPDRYRQGHGARSPGPRIQAVLLDARRRHGPRLAYDA